MCVTGGDLGVTGGDWGDCRWTGGCCLRCWGLGTELGGDGSCKMGMVRGWGIACGHGTRRDKEDMVLGESWGECT